MYIEGDENAKNYTMYLEGNKIYYLHLGYYNSSRNFNKFVINDISLIKGEKENLISSVQANGDYYFEEQNGALVSNNTKRNSTVANSYIRLDLTNSSDIDLVINASVSSQSGDYGYITITENETAPTYGDTTGRIFRISGTTSYNYVSTHLEGGKTYYLHLGYRKDSSGYDESNKNKIANAVFEISYQQVYVAPSLASQSEDAKSMESPTIKISQRFTTSDIENNQMQLYAGREYTIEEILPADGYVKGDSVTKFTVDMENGKYVVNLAEGDTNNFTVEDNTVHLTIENTPSFKLIKQNKTGEGLQGAKFTITTVDGQDVTNGLGELVGEIENINGQDLRVVTTNENGEIYEPLLAGTYKVTEVQAPEGYRLPEENEQIIEIESGEIQEKYSVSEVETKNLNLEYIYNGIDANSFSFFRLEDILNSNKKEVKVGLPDITISEILPSGEIFLTGVLNNNTIISGESTVTGQDITLTKTGAEFDGIFIKTDVNGKIEIITQIKTNEIGNSSIIKAFKTADGYELIGGYEG